MDRRYACALLLALAACDMPDTADLAPPDPMSPAPGQAGFTLAPDARVNAAATPRPAAQPGQVYALATLIDLAQRNNPRTRAAWEHARQAAAAVGLVEASYLPQLSAQVLVGRQMAEGSGLADGLGILPASDVRGEVGATAAVVSLRWLLFDFGRRDAALAGARELSFASNVAFTGAHQLLIHEVAQAFYDLQAARAREAIQTRRLENAQEIAAMARARRAQELATVTELAQAEQVVAQARFDLTRARSESTAANVRLATLTGLTPAQPIRVGDGGLPGLPARPPAEIERFLQDALARRPDLQAAFARARASEAEVAAVEASFRPQIVATAALGHRWLDGRISGSGGAAGLADDRAIGSVFIGVTIPLWDGNARQLRLEAARSGHAAALAEAENLRAVAEGEIISAYEALRAALAANVAAAELVATATTTRDAARSMAAQGLLTVGEVSAAQQLLHDAELAQVEARHAVRSSGALLAFAGGVVAGG